MKKRIVLIALLFCFLFSIPVLADAKPGDVLITLGEDLTEEQKADVLEELNPPEDATFTTITNEEEHQYLGKYIPKAQIGNKALSSSSVTLTEKDSGLTVTTNNITWVTEEMYTNALITAGVKDADIHITAPFEVSGTAALTGIIKAYEINTDAVISEEQKDVANEEMVKSAQLADSIGAEKALQLLTKIKEEIANNPPKTEEDLRALIEQIAADLGVTLTEDEINGLVSLFQRMQDLNIDWNQVGDQLQLAKEKLTNFIESEEGQSILQQLQRFFQSIVQFISELLQPA